MLVSEVHKVKDLELQKDLFFLTRFIEFQKGSQQKQVALVKLKLSINIWLYNNEILIVQSK